MAFRKMTRSPYPPRLWSLVGYPGSGKSTFAARLKGPIVVVDADHRFQEVMHIAENNVFELSDTRSDNVDPNAIATLLGKNMPGSGAKTIVVDSLTAIITPIVVQAMIDHENGKEKNLSAAFRTKALAMRQLQDAVTRWGCDVLWIYHLQDSRDARAQAVTKATVSETELARLTRSINVQLEIVDDKRSGKRGIKVTWARRGRSGVTVWDDSGSWDGMPEKVEEAIYGGLSIDDQERIEKSTPTAFPNPETAVSWAMEQGAFKSEAHARKTYDVIKRDKKPQSAKEMAHLWIDLVQERATRAAVSGGPTDDDAPAVAQVAAAPAATTKPAAAATAPAAPAPAAANGEQKAPAEDCPF
jgi:hypothetical protein